MKLRNLILAMCVLAALAGTLYWSEHRKPAAEGPKAADSAPSILKLDESAITAVELKKRDADPVLLNKTNTGAWQINGPKPVAADHSNVSSTLSSLASLNSERVVEEKPSDLKQYGLNPPSFEVTITEKDTKPQKLLLGDDTPTGSATYAMLTGDPRIFTIASYNRNMIAKSLNDLRDKRLLPLSADQVNHLEIVRNHQTMEFGRSKEEWQILQPKPLRADGTQVSELLQKLTDARMDLNGTDPKEAEAAFSSGTLVARARLTIPSGTQELELRKSKDSYYAKSTAVDGMFKVNTELSQALDKSVDDFRNKKLFDFGYSDPDKVEMHIAHKTYVLTRTGNDWSSEGKKLDVDSVGVVLSNLRDLAADKFVDSGFSNPTIEATVTSGDSKRIEKVAIAKSDTAYIATRDGEPTQYHLPSAAVEALQKAADDLKPVTVSGK
jgi:Domain of unknown function (DUF4340)